MLKGTVFATNDTYAQAIETFRVDFISATISALE